MPERTVVVTVTCVLYLSISDYVTTFSSEVQYHQTSHNLTF